MASLSRLTVIAAYSRPGRLLNILENFGRQHHPDAELLLVANGPARNSEVPILNARTTVLRTQGGTPARARNAGLEFARLAGCGPVAFWDDDDYYGPNYLIEVAEALEGHRRKVVGKVIRYVEFDDGVRLFMRRQRPLFLGGTIAGWAAELPQIPDLPCHEDHEWCRLLEYSGFELQILSGNHYVYNRKSGQHAWRSTLTRMLYCYGPALRFGAIGKATWPPTGGTYVPSATPEDIENEQITRLLAISAAELETRLLT